LGGSGSGRSLQVGTASKCEHWRSIDLAELKRMRLLKPVVGGRIRANCNAAELPAGPGNFDMSFGNSAFGAWTKDEFGLPAFRYDGCSPGACDEPTMPTDAAHQLGNGFATALAHANGYVELFTARNYYRIANHYDPKNRHFAWAWAMVECTLRPELGPITLLVCHRGAVSLDTTNGTVNGGPGKISW